jgi:NADPH-ferrihemoprotein reductase
MSCGTSVNGSSSICGSLAPSLAGSNFASAELERLKRTIMLRERQAGENERRLSSSTSGSTSSRGSFGPVAQLELLQKRMNAKGENESSAMSSAESLARGDSCRSLNTHESPLVDVFYDPSSDAAPYLTIFYATQSGTSEYYAYALQQEGQTMGIDVGICNVSALMHSVEMSLDQDLKDILVPHLSGTGKRRGRALFLVSTYQEGGPSDDGKSFVKAIQEITDHKYLKGLRYCVFGFGCSSFSLTYNSQGKLYDQMLSQLGGKRMLPLGLGDDSKDIDWDFEQWKWKSWWPTMADIASRDNQGSLKSNQKMRKQESEGHDSKYLIEYINPSEFAKHIGVCDKIPLLSVAKHFGDGAEYTVKIVKPLWRDPELNPKLKQSGSTMHVALDITQPIGTPLTFKTGDNVAVLPHNRSSVVEEVAIKLGYDLDAMFVVHPQDPQQECGFELPFPTPCTIRDYLTKYAELTTPPRRSLIRALSKCATLPEERDELYQLSSKKHREMYKSQVVGQRIGLGEFILVYFKSLEIPLAKFITLCTPMQPRWYSLSGSTVVHKDEIHLTFAMVSLERDMDSSFAQGAASHYLGNLPIGAAVKIIRSVPSGFVVPPDPSLPLIMVANGSGVAPMLALIQERHHQKTELGLKVGPTELFFGIRRRDLDFLYREELRRYKLAGSLSSLQLACSREQMHKIYVQHLIVKHAEHVWRLLQRGAHIYVCGGNRMSNEVDLVLRAIVTRHQEGNELSTEEFMTRLANQGRYLQEAFDSMYS